MSKTTSLFTLFSFGFLLATSLLLGFGIENLITFLPQHVQKLPLFYIIASSLIFFLLLEALIKRSKLWVLPSLVIYATTIMWYFTETIYSPEDISKFSNVITEDAYLQVTIFLASFRFLVPNITNKIVSLSSVRRKVLIEPSFGAGQILLYLSILWICLLLFGINRMNGDIFGALFPITSRAGIHMWARGASNSAGDSGFIVSSASYTYILACSFLGVLLPLQKKSIFKLINILLILISWPYFILMGARNTVLAVVSPAYFSYILLSKQKWWFKILVTVVAFTAINYIFIVVISYRNVGFTTVINDINQGAISIPEQKHLGLNMVEELCFINSFYQRGILHLNYGAGYVAEALNFVPRALWPNKPLIGIDYAILRGLGGNRNADVGVFATLSTGFIGQGVRNFGPLFGPIAPALLLSLWAGFLARLWSQRSSLLRLCLFLAGLGITFNLGRDITLLVLWPIVFGYVIVRLIESLNQKKIQSRSWEYY